MTPTNRVSVGQRAHGQTPTKPSGDRGFRGCGGEFARSDIVPGSGVNVITFKNVAKDP
jgi:hypothetical protein